MTIRHITNKQKEILTLFPQFRFLQRKHIQQFLQHKDEKRIQTWLNDLLQKRYIKKVENKNKFPQQSITYTIARNGIIFFKDQKLFPESFLVNLYRDDERSDAFISICFVLANICIELSKASDRKEVFAYMTRSKYVSSDSDFNFLAKLHPNLCLIKKAKGQKATWYLVEIFSSSFPSQEIRRRIHVYVQFLKDEEWGRAPYKTMPVILFVCPSKDIQKYVKQYLKRKLRRYEVESFDISLALEEEIKLQGLRGNIWEEIF